MFTINMDMYTSQWLGSIHNIPISIITAEQLTRGSHLAS